MGMNAFTRHRRRRPSAPHRPWGLSIVTLEISDGLGIWIAQDIWEVHIRGFELMILMATKFNRQAYLHNRLGYNMVCSPEITTESGGAQGGVGLVIWDQSKGWSVESTRFHGTNVVSCKVVSGRKWTPLIGMYFYPSTLEHLLHLEEALTRFCDHNPIVLGYLKAEIGQAQNPRSQQVANLLMEFVLVDISHHFRQLWRLCHMKTWSQAPRDRFLRTRCDYILGTHWHKFEMVGIRDVRNYSSDHFKLRARILQRLMWCHGS